LKGRFRGHRPPRRKTKLMFLWLADFIVVTHGVLVAAVTLGAVAAMAGRLRRHPRWERAYYALLVGVIVANVVWGECPLTRWEQDLRNLNAPGSAYRNSFTGHYLWVLPHSVLTWLVPALMGGAFLAAPLWRWADRSRGLTSGLGTLR